MKKILLLVAISAVCLTAYAVQSHTVPNAFGGHMYLTDKHNEHCKKEGDVDAYYAYVTAVKDGKETVQGEACWIETEDEYVVFPYKGNSTGQVIEFTKQQFSEYEGK
jgi:hypothetical protein